VEGAQHWAAQTSEALRREGYRSGAARRVVVDVLSRQTCCMTAVEVWDAIRSEGGNVGIASVYRILDLLTDKGLVQRIELGAGKAHFEPIRPEAHHHHLVCDECGRVDAFEDEALETTLRRVENETGYAIARHDVLLRGACDDCRS
jgi:Fur family ferric uptake transcriptional regulator